MPFQALLEQKDLSRLLIVFQQLFLTAHTEIVFDRRITVCMSVNFGTSHWNILLPKTDTLIRFEADIKHPSSQCPASRK